MTRARGTGRDGESHVLTWRSLVTQLALFGAPAEPPAPVAAPAPVVDVDPLVELVGHVDHEPVAEHGIFDPATAVLWTDGRDDRWHTVVPASVAARLESLAPGCFDRVAVERPTHLLRVGDRVATRNGDVGPHAVLGFVRAVDDADAGAVLDVDGTPQVAWLDTASLIGGHMVVATSDRYVCSGPDADGWWTIEHRQVAERAAPTKTTTTKAPKPARKPSTKPRPARLTPVPDADAIAVQGKLSAVAYQLGTNRWELWETSPTRAGETLTGPEWAKLWQRAEKSGLRVRVYGRARQCTHDSTDNEASDG